MKACVTCGRLYPSEAGFCPVDGSALIGASQAPPEPDDADPRLGQVVLGRYEVRRVVADGGMGRVYEALDLQDRKRNVALKILHPAVAQDHVQVQRFKREYEVSAQLSHDHVIQVHDFSRTPQGDYVMVMEFLFGEELRALLDREKGLSLARALRMVSQVAIALDEAHARKFVHRDLKPDNIFLCQTSEGDVVKLLDFGSVKDKAQGAAQLTVLGTTIGSPFYMSPEQAQGLQSLDHRADVWALGAIVFEVLTGKVPFFGKEHGQILLAILTKQPSPVSSVGGAKEPIPRTLDRVLAQAFRKEPALRFDSAGLLADAVGHALGLDADHRKWAYTPEAELSAWIHGQATKVASIEAKLPESNAQDEFFGELGLFDRAAPPPISLAPGGGQSSQMFAAPPPISLAPEQSKTDAEGSPTGSSRDPGPFAESMADTLPHDRLEPAKQLLTVDPGALGRLSSRRAVPTTPSVMEKPESAAPPLSVPDSLPPAQAPRLAPDSLMPSIPAGLPKRRALWQLLLPVFFLLGAVIWWTVF